MRCRGHWHRSMTKVHAQIAELALALAHGLLRRELRADPSQVIGMVRQTVALLPASARGVRIALHPEDAALVRERLLVAGPESAWSLIDDPVLGRGDCRVHTDYAQIDARIEVRLKACWPNCSATSGRSPAWRNRDEQRTRCHAMA